MGLSIEALPSANGNQFPEIIVDPPGGPIPYQEWARVRRDEVLGGYLAGRNPTHAQVDGRSRGWPDALPRINFYSQNPFQILQTHDSIVILYEAQHEFRVIPLDDRPHPDAAIRLWMGSSRAHWDGDTLVVDVVSTNDRTRLSVVGDFHSDQFRVTERWTRVGPDRIHYAATLHDPAVFTRSWTVATMLDRHTEPGYELLEYAGVEGERDVSFAVAPK